MADDVSAYDKISAARTREEADAVLVEVERGGFKPFGECTRDRRGSGSPRPSGAEDGWIGVADLVALTLTEFHRQVGKRGAQ